jgi:hypothetical protein
MPARDPLTRRGLLALVGTGATAGCSGLDGPAGGEPDAVSGHRLPDVDEESAGELPVQPSVPVGIAQSHLDAARDRASALLATLPLPLGPDDVPNGHVRRDLADAADRATDELDGALAAGTPLAALRALRCAREHARYAAAGWAVVEDGLTADRVRRAHGRSVADARSLRGSHAHVGRDPVRATLVHARIETALERASGEARPHPSHDGADLLAVAAWGEEAESVRALVADARHLDARFTASLPDDAGSVAATIRGAAETLLADVRSRRSDLPPEPTADDWGVAERLVADLRRDATGGPGRTADAPGPAAAVVDANGRLASLRALRRVRPRLDGADVGRIESAADVGALRTDAYDALRTALEASPAPELARTVVTDAAGRVASADWELSRVRGDVRSSRFDDVAANYLAGTALARATPDACRRTVDALRAG